MRKLAVILLVLACAVTAYAGPDRNSNTLSTTRGNPPEVLTATSAAAFGGTATVIAAVAAKQIVVLGISVSSGDTTAIADLDPALVQLKDGAGGAVKWQAALGPGNALADFGPAGGPLFKLTTNTLLQYSVSGTAGSMYVNVRYILED